MISSLKEGVHNTKTQLQAVTQQLRHVVRERDTYRGSLEKLRGELSRNIHSLQLQLDEAVGHLRDEMLLNTALRQDLMTSSLSQVSFTTSATTFPGAAGVTPSPADCEDLHDASRRGNLEEVKRILSLKVYVNCRRQSRTPVMASAGEGHIQVVELLVGKGADVSLVDGDGNNTLHWACYGGDVETVKFVLSLNVVDIESRGIGSWTPVMVAARRGHMEVVELLVGKGADVSLVDVHGYNILHLACWGKHVKMVKFVLSLNVVDIDSRGYRRWTPMMVAARRGNRKVVALLLAKGADVSLVDAYNDNILHLACMGGHVKMVKFVLSLNVVDIDCRGFDSQTPVMGAARQGHGEVVELLVNEGADVSLVDDLGDNILHHACAGGNMKTVKLVLSLNVVDVDARNKVGQTAVYWARRRGHQRVVKLLESRGAQ
ncbi:ankyrin-1-like [Haliotis cracherodii]|uniref:ankyrin-1-like n=1 Tax=Haliotis cracherodii TaxID=6455 RepID=UPI0039E8ED77